VHAAWPRSDAALCADDVEQKVAVMQQWCVAIREARARYQVASRERVAARFQADGDTAAVLRATGPLLANMAGLGDVAIGPDQQRSADAATVVLGNAKVFLLGVVDMAKEKQKLEQQLAQLAGRIGGIEKKLGNEGFVKKAPPQVVESERENLAALKQQLAGVQQSLAELG
jgi:valyl-tRNA synthetase